MKRKTLPPGTPSAQRPPRDPPWRSPCSATRPRACCSSSSSRPSSLFGGKLVGVDVPFLVAAVFGVLIALPLGMYLFKSLRLKVNSEISAIEADRRARHDDLQSRLRGGQVRSFRMGHLA